MKGSKLEPLYLEGMQHQGGAWYVPWGVPLQKVVAVPMGGQQGAAGGGRLLHPLLGGLGALQGLGALGALGGIGSPLALSGGFLTHHLPPPHRPQPALAPHPSPQPALHLRHTPPRKVS